MADGADLGAEIEIEREVEVVIAHFEHGAGMDDAGAIEEDVDMADLGDRFFNRRVGEHVEHARRDIGRAIELAELGFVDVGRDHFGASLGKGARRGLANALGSGGDENDFSGQVGHFIPLVMTTWLPSP
jgi:hypothetical protein